MWWKILRQHSVFNYKLKISAEQIWVHGFEEKTQKQTLPGIKRNRVKIRMGIWKVFVRTGKERGWIDCVGGLFYPRRRGKIDLRNRKYWILCNWQSWRGFFLTQQCETFSELGALGRSVRKDQTGIPSLWNSNSEGRWLCGQGWASRLLGTREEWWMLCQKRGQKAQEGEGGRFQEGQPMVWVGSAAWFTAQTLLIRCFAVCAPAVNFFWTVNPCLRRSAHKYIAAEN